MTSEPASAPGSLRPRPLSPHLQIYRWQLTSVLSILHRASGVALAGGAVLLVWWLTAAASGPAAYAAFSAAIGSILGRIFLFGWTLAFFYHLANGIRHLWWDTGRGLDLPSVYRSGWSVLAFTGAASLLAWIVGYWIREAEGMDTRSPIARVRGLGSAKEGVRHWWAQRVTAVALVPLSIWFVAGVVAMSGAPWEEAAAWIAHPLTAALLILLLALGFHHGQLGLQVAIEDYVHAEGPKLAALILVKLSALALALAGILAVLRLMLAEAA